MPIALDGLSDEQLIERARRLQEGSGTAEAEACLSELYRRYYPKVAAWCLRICGDRDEAADVAQEVFLRVHERLGSFRGDSRFSTWLYTVTRSVAVNRGIAARRRHADQLDEETGPELVEPAPDAERQLARSEILAAFRQAMERDLEPLEARVIYLHYVDGVPLAAVTEMLGLENKSGAKAHVVSAGRKLKRRFGRWLERQSAGGILP
jgi:RNA polymerase sigma-70 factor, ECF subfamily